MHCGTWVCHLLQELKVPGSNLDKAYKLIELEMMQDRALVVTLRAWEWTKSHLYIIIHV